MTYRFVVIIALLALPYNVLSNNISLRNGEVVGNQIALEIAWDNSWNFTNEEGSYDAVWLFAKGRTLDGLWHPIKFSPHTPEHVVYGDMVATAVEDSMGVFISCARLGGYDIPNTHILLTSTSHISAFQQVIVHGIEMVYIPQGDFYLGDGVSISSFASDGESPYPITSEGGIAGDLKIINLNTEFEPSPLPSTVPEGFPKGYAPFFVMKYEVSQVQYAHFLNTLTYKQQKARTWNSPSSFEGTFTMVHPFQPDSLYRNGIVIVRSGQEGGTPAKYGINGNGNKVFNEIDDGSHRAANFLSWADLSAYLCWAGLRPITEFEFEKACRGGGMPVEGEYAWGTQTVTNANTIVNDGLPSEMVTEVAEANSGLANHGNVAAVEGWGLRGPLRTGFAANQSTSRQQAGATYYGLMEMSGNVWEMVVMAADGGEAFTRICGNGLLDENGDANIPTWCNPQTANGVIYKGGAWGSTISEVGSWRDLAISDRFYSHLRPSQRRNTSGGRGGR